MADSIVREALEARRALHARGRGRAGRRCDGRMWKVSSQHGSFGLRLAPSLASESRQVAAMEAAAVAGLPMQEVVRRSGATYARELGLPASPSSTLCAPMPSAPTTWARVMRRALQRPRSGRRCRRRRDGDCQAGQFPPAPDSTSCGSAAAPPVPPGREQPPRRGRCTPTTPAGCCRARGRSARAGSRRCGSSAARTPRGRRRCAAARPAPPSSPMPSTAIACRTRRSGSPSRRTCTASGWSRRTIAPARPSTTPPPPRDCRMAVSVQVSTCCGAGNAGCGSSEPTIHSIDSGAAAVSHRESRLWTCSSLASASSRETPRSAATDRGMARSRNGTPRRSATAGPTTDPPAP